MGRSRRLRTEGSGLGVVSPSSVRIDGALSEVASSSVPQVLPLADGSSLELQPDDPAMLLRGLAEIEDVRFLRDGSFEVSFRDGDQARLLLDEGRIAFLSGNDDQALVLAAFARALALRSDQSSDPMGLSMDPDTKRAFLELSQMHRKLSEDPSDPELLREFAQLSEALMREGLLNDPRNPNSQHSPLLPNELEVNGSALTRKLSGEPEDPADLPNSTRRAREMAARINEAMDRVRQSSGPFANNPMAAFFNASSAEALETIADRLGADNIQERSKAALIVSEQLDPNRGCPSCQGSAHYADNPCGSCYSTGLMPTGKYEHLTPFLNGQNPNQTHGIPISITAQSRGGLDLTPSQWNALGAMRTDHRGGRRFFLLRGPASSGKDTVAKEFCAGMMMAKVPVNLGGSASSGPESAIGTEALQTRQIRRLKLDESGEPRMVPSYEKEADGTLKLENGEKVPVIDPKTGEQAMEYEYEEGGFAVSGANLGEIGRNAHLPVAFVISDPNGHEKEFTRMHDALGSDAAQPNGRYVMVDASSGGVLPLHPSSTFVITTNEYKTLKNPSGRFTGATMSRALALEVENPDETEEAQRIAHMVQGIFNLDTPSDVDHRDVNPELADLDITHEEVMPFVRAQRKLVAATVSDAEIVDEVVARTTSYATAAYLENILGSTEGEYGGTAMNPVDAFVARMTSIIPMDKGTQEQREDKIRDIILDEIGAMEGQVGPIAKRIREIRRGNGDPERLAREKAAAEAASRSEQQEAEEAAAKEEV